jgi:hypothetical protein
MIYVDKYGHMVAGSIAELHEFAERMGMKRHFYQGVKKGHPHYDLTTQRKKDLAIHLGAIVVSPKKIVKLSRSMQ